MPKKAFILNYHLIDDGEQFFDELGAVYAVKKSNFQKQMQCLHDLKIPVVPLDQILNNTVLDDFCVAITFDDGQLSDYEIAFPVLRNFGFTATFFLSHYHVEMNQCSLGKYKEMVAAGFNIGSHGMRHLDLTQLNQVDLQSELSDSRSWLENELECAVTLFSLPFGKFNKLVVDFALKNGYLNLFSTEFDNILPDRKSPVLGRWSIKRSTEIDDFRKIISQNRFMYLKYKSGSKLKKRLVKLLGTKWANQLNTFRYKS